MTVNANGSNIPVFNVTYTMEGAELPRVYFLVGGENLSPAEEKANDDFCQELRSKLPDGSPVTGENPGLEVRNLEANHLTIPGLNPATYKGRAVFVQKHGPNTLGHTQGNHPGYTTLETYKRIEAISKRIFKSFNLHKDAAANMQKLLNQLKEINEQLQVIGEPSVFESNPGYQGAEEVLKQMKIQSPHTPKRFNIPKRDVNPNSPNPTPATGATPPTSTTPADKPAPAGAASTTGQVPAQRPISRLVKQLQGKATTPATPPPTTVNDTSAKPVDKPAPTGAPTATGQEPGKKPPSGSVTQANGKAPPTTPPSSPVNSADKSAGAASAGTGTAQTANSNAPKPVSSLVKKFGTRTVKGISVGSAASTGSAIDSSNSSSPIGASATPPSSPMGGTPPTPPPTPNNNASPANKPPGSPANTKPAETAKPETAKPAEPAKLKDKAAGTSDASKTADKTSQVKDVVFPVLIAAASDKKIPLFNVAYSKDVHGQLRLDYLLGARELDESKYDELWKKLGTTVGTDLKKDTSLLVRQIEKRDYAQHALPDDYKGRMIVVRKLAQGDPDFTPGKHAGYDAYETLDKVSKLVGTQFSVDENAPANMKKFVDVVDAFSTELGAPANFYTELFPTFNRSKEVIAKLEEFIKASKQPKPAVDNSKPTSTAATNASKTDNSRSARPDEALKSAKPPQTSVVLPKDDKKPATVPSKDPAVVVTGGDPIVAKPHVEAVNGTPNASPTPAISTIKAEPLKATVEGTSIARTIMNWTLGFSITGVALLALSKLSEAYMGVSIVKLAFERAVTIVQNNVYASVGITTALIAGTILYKRYSVKAS